MENSYFKELEKLANDLLMVEDHAAEPMTEDPQPKVVPEDVEAVQAGHSADSVPSEAMEQQPASPEDVAALEAALVSAQNELEQAKETLASVEEEYSSFEKTAQSFFESLPTMGALARLIECSTGEEVEESLRKLASERLTNALESEDAYSDVLQKTALELFEEQDSLNQLYSDEGIQYVTEHLATFVQDEELEKVAFELGGVVNSARKWAGETIDSAANFFKLKDELAAANAEVSRLDSIVAEKTHALNEARVLGDQTLVDQLQPQFEQANLNWTNAKRSENDLESKVARGGTALVGGAAGVVGGALYGGKKIADAVQKPEEEQLSEKTASDTINQEESVNGEGGIIDMSNSIVKDFLKIAGAAVLLDIANDESAEQTMRKEAADSFNAIARMGRKDMEENFVKVATQLYSEEQLHEIVSGNHNEELFSKIAFFTDVNDLSADELEKVAGAESVAAKGVGAALTDAKSNITEKIEGDKKKTETVANGEIGTKKSDDMRGYNVINNPGEYQVEKSAALKAMLDEAELRKEAAYREFINADTFIKNNISSISNN